MTNSVDMILFLFPLALLRVLFPIIQDILAQSRHHQPREIAVSSSTNCLRKFKSSSFKSFACSTSKKSKFSEELLYCSCDGERPFSHQTNTPRNELSDR